MSTDAVVWAARRTVEMHVPNELVSWQTGRCAGCTDDRCDMLAWATTVLTTAEMNRVQPATR